MIDKVRRYIRNVREALRSSGNLMAEGHARVNVRSLLDAASRYADDAEYYLSKGDLITALAAASYAEGLIDALKYLGLTEPSWPQEGQKRVFVAGTFDIIHPGHISLLEFASSLGDVYLTVARDVNVERVKGRRPVLDELSRLRVVSSIKYVQSASLGSEDDIFDSIEETRPHIVVLGPDQPQKEEHIVAEAERRLGYKPEVIRYEEKREFSPGMRGSRDIIKTICLSYCGR